MPSFSLVGLLRGGGSERGGGRQRGGGARDRSEDPGTLHRWRGERNERGRGREGEVDTTTSFAFHF